MIVFLGLLASPNLRSLLPLGKPATFKPEVAMARPFSLVPWSFLFKIFIVLTTRFLLVHKVVMRIARLIIVWAVLLHSLVAVQVGVWMVLVIAIDILLVTVRVSRSAIVRIIILLRVTNFSFPLVVMVLLIASVGASVIKVMFLLIAWVHIVFISRIMAATSCVRCFVVWVFILMLWLWRPLFLILHWAFPNWVSLVSWATLAPTLSSLASRPLLLQSLSADLFNGA